VHTSRILSILTAVALAGTALPALAEQVTLAATLTGAEEVPANTAPGTGNVDATFDTDTNVFTYTVSYEGLTGAATAAHFHGPAAPGENAGPVVPVEGDLTSPISGTATLTDAQEAELLGGMWYFNVHTAQYPDGELRGQVLQSMVSTLPSTESSMEAPASSEPSSELSSSSSSVDISTSVSVSASVSASVDPSSTLSSLSSEVSSAVSSASSELSSILDPSVSISASASVSVAP
jgi:hypothetical protein